MSRRIRQTRPEFYTDEITGRLPIPMRDLFRSLWTVCDDRGIGPASPLELKAVLYPGCDEATIDWIEAGLEYLHSESKRADGSGLIVRYSVGGKHWFLIPTFPKFQYSKKADSSSYPAPAGWTLQGDRWMDESARCGK